MKKLFRIVLIIGVISMVAIIIGLFFFDTVTAYFGSFVCPAQTILHRVPSPKYGRNVLFECIGDDGSHVDATTSLFSRLCLSLFIPYIVILTGLGVGSIFTQVFNRLRA